MPYIALEKDKFKDLENEISGETITFPRNIKVQTVNNCNIFIQSVSEQPLLLENTLEGNEKKMAMSRLSQNFYLKVFR